MVGGLLGWESWSAVPFWVSDVARRHRCRKRPPSPGSAAARDPSSCCHWRPTETVLGDPWRVDDRWVFAIHEYDGDVSFPHRAQVEHSLVGTRLVSVDDCGEDVRTVVDGGAWPVYQSEGTAAEETVWLACSLHTGELWQFDPAGDEPPVSLGLTHGSLVTHSDGPDDYVEFHRCDRVLATDDAVVVQRPNDGDGFSVERVTLDDALTTDPLANGSFVDAHWDGGAPEVFVLDETLGLVVVDADTGESEVLAEPPVFDPEVVNGRYVAWREGPTATELVVPRPHEWTAGAVRRPAARHRSGRQTRFRRDPSRRRGLGPRQQRGGRRWCGSKPCVRSPSS